MIAVPWLFMPREHREQPLDLARFQRGGRLVEDQDAAAPAQRLGDGDELALGEAQAVDADVGIGRKVELRQRCARLLAHARAIDERQAEHAPHRQIAERRGFRQPTARGPAAVPAEW